MISYIPDRRHTSVITSVILLTALLGLSLFASYSDGAESKSAKRVLMLFSESNFIPGNTLVEQAAREALQRSDRPMEFFAEYLDAGRFPEEGHYRLFCEYLQVKYRQQPPDLIMAFLARKFELAGQLPAELFPGVPVVFAALTEEQIPSERFGDNVTGLVQRVDFIGGLKMIVKLQPETERIIVIGGVAPLDQTYLSHTRAAVRLLPGHIQFEFWNTRSVAEMIDGVSSLPPRTVILFTTVFRDAAGKTFFPETVVSDLAKSANAPIYVFLDTMIAKGAVGGAIASIEAAGRRAGELAGAIFEGAAPSSLPIEVRKEGVPIFNGRALERWGISEGRLPPNSIVRFRPQSFWDEYRWYIIAALIIILIQSAIIADLLLERRRRRRIQAQLGESQQMMELAATAGELGLWARDLKSGAVWVNSAVRSMFGFSPNDSIQAGDMLARVHPDDAARVLADVQSAQKDHLSFEGEFRVVLPDGKTRWLFTKGRTVEISSGDGLRRMGVVLDVTERKQGGEALEKERAFLRQVIDVTPHFIFAKDRQGRFTLANQAVADAYGTTVENLIGKTDADFNANRDEVEFFRRMDLEVINTLQERFIPEEPITDARGNTRWLQTVKRPILESDGAANQVLGAATDITNRKAAELQIQEQRAQLAHVSRISMMGELAASLAHELNQPLTAILSNAQAALRFAAGDRVDMNEVVEILRDIVKDNNRATEVIQRVRALVKKEELEFYALDMRALLCEVVALVHSDAILQNVEVILKLDPGLPMVRGDRVQLQQVALNILLNAFDAMSGFPANQRRATVRAEAYGRMIKVSVRDTGKGLSGENVEKLFQPFYTTKPDGLGIGLSICRSIIEAHHGHLWTENNTGEHGATFYFTLPIDGSS